MNITASANTDGTVDLVGFQGSTWNFSIIAYQDDARTSPMDLNGYSARGQIRKSHAATAIAATFVCTIPVPANGQIDISLDAVATAALKAGETAAEEESQYVYDIEIFTGTPAVVTRIMRGKLTNDPEVTK